MTAPLTTQPAAPSQGSAKAKAVLASVKQFLKKFTGGTENLFFVRRRPRPWGIPLEWTRPTDDQYQTELESHDFISIPKWEASHKVALKDTHPVVYQDLQDIDEHLLPRFFEASQRSTYFQNRFYLYQWIFVFGAFLTTIFGVISVYKAGEVNSVASSSSSGSQVQVTLTPSSPTSGNQPQVTLAPSGGTSGAANAGTGSADANQNPANSPAIWSTLTAIVGIFTGVFTAVNTRRNPQVEWANARRLTEALRMYYFKFLSHLPPYHEADRLDKLRQNVLEARIGPDASKQPLPDPQPSSRDPHAAGDRAMLLGVYLEKRINAQTNFYKSRIKENEKNSNFTFGASALILSAAALPAVLSPGAFGGRAPFLGALLPALAGLIAAFRQIYGWDRQAAIYRDAVNGLERVSGLVPDNDDAGKVEVGVVFNNLVIATENVLSGEAGQWGQFALDKNKEAGQPDQMAFDQLVSNLKLTDDEKGKIQNIMDAAKGR